MSYNKGILSYMTLSIIFLNFGVFATGTEQDALKNSKIIKDEVLPGQQANASNKDLPPAKKDLGGSKGFLKNKSQQNKIDDENLLLQSRFKQVINPYIEGASCDNTVLTAFGITGPGYKTPVLATADETAYCRRNKYTCCTVKNYEETIPNFTENAKKFMKVIEPIEELLTLFKGPAYKEFINKVSNKKECKAIVKDFVDSSGTPIDFFSEIYTKRRLNEVKSLLGSIESYMKKMLSFHANLICAMCNPYSNKYFNLKEGNSEIKVVMATCSDIMEGYEYDLRLAQSYNIFFKVVAELAKCDQGLKPEDEPKMPVIEAQKIKEMEENFQDCLKNFTIGNEKCQAICSKDMATYKPNIEFFVPSFQALRVIYKAIVGQEIEEYYQTTYQKAFPTKGPEDIKFFDDQSKSWVLYNISNIKWSYEATGIDVYQQHMSRRFVKIDIAEVY